MTVDKFLRVTMPDGSKWEVPAQVIADDRARVCKEDDPGADFEEEAQFILNDDYGLKDWAVNNMNWCDVKKYARKVSDAPPMSDVDFEDGWANGNKEVIERVASSRENINDHV